MGAPGFLNIIWRMGEDGKSHVRNGNGRGSSYGNGHKEHQAGLRTKATAATDERG
jgi:hypothetical protein